MSDGTAHCVEERLFGLDCFTEQTIEWVDAYLEGKKKDGARDSAKKPGSARLPNKGRKA